MCKKYAKLQVGQEKNSYWYVIIKVIMHRTKILKAAENKDQVTYKGRSIRITLNFWMDTLKARMSWAAIF